MEQRGGSIIQRRWCFHGPQRSGELQRRKLQRRVSYEFRAGFQFSGTEQQCFQQRRKQRSPLGCHRAPHVAGMDRDGLCKPSHTRPS